MFLTCFWVLLKRSFIEFENCLFAEWEEEYSFTPFFWSPAYYNKFVFCSRISFDNLFTLFEKQDKVISCKNAKEKKIVFSSACNCKKLDFFFIFRFKIVNDQNKY